jgi:hypothetical protein
VRSSLVKAFWAAPVSWRVWFQRDLGTVSVPRNIMCSKKCAKPDFPASTSLRLPVHTGIWRLTRPLTPVGITTTRRPLARVFWWMGKGKAALGAGAAAMSSVGTRARGRVRMGTPE